MARDVKDTRRDSSKEDKLKALDAAISQIEKQYGKGSVMKLGDESNRMNVETVPTGALSLDIALGLGGLPKGRIIEIYGPESSGKTTVALHAVAEVQKRGGIAGFIDAEHALDPAYAKNIGVDIDELYISKMGYLLGDFHGFIHRCRLRNPVQEHQLIQTDGQKNPHFGIHLAHRTGR